MLRQLMIAAVSAGTAFCAVSTAYAEGDGGIREVLQLAVIGDAAAGHVQPGARSAGHRHNGGIEKQTGHVVTSCFPASLRAVLGDISAHFGGKPVIVTSGHRHGGRRGSFHRKCMAADIQIAGVSPGAIARYARSHPSVGGVGTYGHTRSVHVDVGGRVYSWYGNSRRKRYAQTAHGKTSS